MDLWKLVFVILLIGALVAVAVWFAGNALSTIATTGASARSAMGGAVSAWSAVSGVFSSNIGTAFGLALKIAGAFTSVFLTFRLVKWVNGA